MHETEEEKREGRRECTGEERHKREKRRKRGRREGQKRAKEKKMCLEKVRIRRKEGGNNHFRRIKDER